MYNGWINYETWCTNLWITNDEGGSRYWEQRTEELIIENEFDKDCAIQELADELTEEIYNGNPLSSSSSSLYRDMLDTSLSAIDFYEIADNWVSDIYDRVVEDNREDEDEETAIEDSV